MSIHLGFPIWVLVHGQWGWFSAIFSSTGGLARSSLARNAGFSVTLRDGGAVLCFRAKFETVTCGQRNTSEGFTHFAYGAGPSSRRCRAR